MTPCTIQRSSTPEELQTVKPAVQALFKSVFGKPLTDRAWEHYYLNAPQGCSHSFDCFIEGRLAAHGGIIPQLLADDAGNSHRYFLQTGIMIDQQHRNLRLFNDLMQAIHVFVRDQQTFVIAFPNDNTFLPFTKMLKWRFVNEYRIRQYARASTPGTQPPGGKVPAGEYRFALPLDTPFLQWRTELNNMSVLNGEGYCVVWKDYEGTMEILEIRGSGVPFADIMTGKGYAAINIPDSLLPQGEVEGLAYIKDVGIPQRFCAYPSEYARIAYEDIKPSLLLSDVF